MYQSTPQQQITSLNHALVSNDDSSSISLSSSQLNKHFDYLKLIEPDFQNKIGKCVFYILEKRYHSRKYLCKFVLNALNNYFLEDFGSVGLKEKMGLSTLKQVKKSILQKVKSCKKLMPQYMKVLNEYLNQHQSYGTLSIYQNILRNIICEGKCQLDFETSEISENIDLKNKEQIKSIMKQGIALLLLQHSYYPEFKNINEIWNSLFTESSLSIPSKRVKQLSASEKSRSQKQKAFLQIQSTSSSEQSIQILNKNEDVAQKIESEKHAECLNETSTNQQYKNYNYCNNNYQQDYNYFNFVSSNGLFNFNESYPDNIQYYEQPDYLNIQNQDQMKSNDYFQELNLIDQQPYSYLNEAVPEDQIQNQQIQINNINFQVLQEQNLDQSQFYFSHSPSSFLDPSQDFSSNSILTSLQ